MSVPKIIHQFWIGDNPPTKAMDTIKNMNPDIEYMFWDEEKCKSDLPIKHKYQIKIDLMKELNVLQLLWHFHQNIIFQLWR